MFPKLSLGNNVFCFLDVFWSLLPRGSRPFPEPGLPSLKSSEMWSTSQPLPWLHGCAHGIWDLPSSSERFWLGFLPGPVKAQSVWLAPHPVTLGVEPEPWDRLQWIPSSAVGQAPGLGKALGWAPAGGKALPWLSGPAASEARDIEMQIPGLHLIPTDSESLGVGARTLFLTSAQSDSYVLKDWKTASEPFLFSQPQFPCLKWGNYSIYCEHRKSTLEKS